MSPRRPASRSSISAAARPRTTSSTRTATAPRGSTTTTTATSISSSSTVPRATISRQGGDPIVALYQNDGKGHFKDVTVASGLSRKGWGMGACVADVRQRRLRRCLRHRAFGPNVLFHNNGDGTFTDVTRLAGVGDTRWSTGCAFGDYNRDGYVDLYVANYVAFDERTIAKRGETAELPLHDRGCVLRSEGTGGRSRRAVSQQWQRHLHRRDARRPASRILATPASASCFPIWTTTAGRISTSPTIRRRTSCSTTITTARFPRSAWSPAWH